MPLYKYVGNKVLTRYENAMAGTDLSEWHSGYRAYSVAALRTCPSRRNDDDFNFDTQIIVQLPRPGSASSRSPSPPSTATRSATSNGLKYARLITRDVIRYRAHKLGFGTGELAFASEAYEAKESETSSHGRIVDWLEDAPGGGCSTWAARTVPSRAGLTALGHHVTGVDIAAPTA